MKFEIIYSNGEVKSNYTPSLEDKSCLYELVVSALTGKLYEKVEEVFDRKNFGLEAKLEINITKKDKEEGE